MEDLLRHFENLGKNDIQKEILKYFKTEMKSNAVTMDSKVFPSPANASLVALNKTSVKVCLLKNWRFIQNAYPCVPNYSEVVAKIDLIFTFRFPYMDVNTGIIYGVETVQDYFDFAWYVIVRSCKSCIVNPGRSCNVTVNDLTKRLKNCKYEKCKETRKEALEFFIFHSRKKFANSSVELGLTTLNPETPKVLTQMIEKNEMSDWGNQISKQLEQKYAGKEVTFTSDRSKPILPQIIKTEASVLNAKKKNFFTRERALDEILTIFRDVNVVFTLSRSGDGTGIDVQNVEVKGDFTVPDGDQKKVIEGVLTSMSEELYTHGTLNGILGFVNAVQITELPMTFEIRGDMTRDGKFNSKVVVFVAGGEMTANTMSHMRRGLGRNNVKVMMDTKINMDTADTSSHIRTNGVSNDQARMDMIEDLRGELVTFNGDMDKEAVEKQAKEISKIMFGEPGKSFLNNEELTASVVVSEKTVDGQIGVMEEISNMYTRLVIDREIAAGLDVKAHYEMYLEVAKIAEDRRRGNNSEISTSTQVSTRDGKSNIEWLDKSIYLDLFKKSIAEYNKGLDKEALGTIPGWERFKSDLRAPAGSDERLEATANMSAARRMMEAEATVQSFKAHLMFGEFKRENDGGNFLLGGVNTLVDTIKYFTTGKPSSASLNVYQKVLGNSLEDQVSSVDHSELLDFAKASSFQRARNVPTSWKNMYSQSFERTLYARVAIFLVLLLFMYKRKKSTSKGGDAERKHALYYNRAYNGALALLTLANYPAGFLFWISILANKAGKGAEPLVMETIGRMMSPFLPSPFPDITDVETLVMMEQNAEDEIQDKNRDIQAELSQEQVDADARRTVDGLNGEIRALRKTIRDSKRRQNELNRLKP